MADGKLQRRRLAMALALYGLVLNERAARELGFTFPGAIVLAADHIIR